MTLTFSLYGYLLTKICFFEASDLGQVWGWGYGGEGQLGLGSRIRTVSSPHPVPCIESALYSKDRPSAMKGNKAAEGHVSKVLGNCVRAIACGGRHSAVVTGQLYIFLVCFC